MPTWILELDWLYGCNRGDFRYGMPRGAVALWAGSPGIGKTRAAMAVVRKMAVTNRTVLVFCLDMPPSVFRDIYCRELPVQAKVYVSDDNTLAGQIQSVQRIAPDLIIVDSVNRIQEFCTRTGAERVSTEYRQVARTGGCHVILISGADAATSPRKST